MKLEKKQVPLFAALCVVTVVMLGYAVFSLLGAGQAKPAAAGTPVASAPQTPEAPQAREAPPGMPVLQPSYRDDPFRPVLHAEVKQSGRGRPAVARRPQTPAPVKVAVRETLPPLQSPDGFMAPDWTPPAAAAVRKAPPVRVAARPATAPLVPAVAPPVKPAFTLTGIVEGETPVAILRLSDTERQVVQEKDCIAERYVVDEITANAVVLVAGTDRWRLFLED
jgi:hypothetical protein